MTLHSIPHIHRSYMKPITHWSKWKAKFAWIPIKLPYRVSGQETQFRWLWFKTYWVRERSGVAILYGSPRDYIQYDYAFTVLDLLRKS